MKMIDKKTSRREFLVNTALLVGTASVVAPMVKAQEKRKAAPAAAGGVQMVDEKSPEAIQVKYLADAKKATDKALMIERQGVAFAKQRCKNCAMFQGKETDKTAACPIFPNKHVAAEGICQSWVKKA